MKMSSRHGWSYAAVHGHSRMTLACGQPSYSRFVVGQRWLSMLISVGCQIWVVRKVDKKYVSSAATKVVCGVVRAAVLGLWVICAAVTKTTLYDD